jgi:hypothetical protein
MGFGLKAANNTGMHRVVPAGAKAPDKTPPHSPTFSHIYVFGRGQSYANVGSRTGGFRSRETDAVIISLFPAIF